MQVPSSISLTKPATTTDSAVFENQSKLVALNLLADKLAKIE
jgi:hypothetical protein